MVHAATQAPNDDLVARTVAAQILGVSPTTVTRWAREGRLACRVTLGGHHRFERAVLNEIRDRMEHGVVAHSDSEVRGR